MEKVQKYTFAWTQKQMLLFPLENYHEITNFIFTLQDDISEILVLWCPAYKY